MERSEPETSTVRKAGRHTGCVSLQHLYHSSRTINKKLDDLKDLLDFIPPVYHTFNHNLKQPGADSHEKDEEEEEGLETV